MTDEAVEPTCAKTGLTEGSHCSSCGKVFVAQQTILATGNHVFGEWVTTKEPTTTEEGLMEKTCACGKKETQKIDKIVPELQYTLNSDGESYSVTGIGTWDKNAVTIPSTYNELPVTAIGASAFKNCNKITSINIPSSIVSIGNYAFDGCSNLSKVYISDLAAWCNIDFGYEREKDDGYIDYYGASNPLIYADTFYVNSSSVTTLVIPQGVTEIKPFAFYGGTNFTSVTIPNSVTSIGICAFSGCSNIEKVYISDLAAWCNIDFGYDYDSSDGTEYYYCYSNPLSISGNLYVNNVLVEDLTIPEGVTEIKAWAFYKAKFTKLTLPSTLVEICEGAFEMSQFGSELIIPEGVTLIYDHAFYGCTSMNSVTIPTTLNTVGVNAFRDCYNLEAVYISDLDAWCHINFYWDADWDEGYWQDCHANPLRYAQKLYLNGEHIRHIEVSYLSDYSFQGADILSVTLADGITHIPDGAFNNCSSLTEIILPDSVTKIGNYSFTYCSSVKYAIFNNVSSIGYTSVWGMSSVQAIYCKVYPFGIDTEPNYYYKDDIVCGYHCIKLDGAIYGIKDGEATLLRMTVNVSDFEILSTIEYNGVNYSVTAIGKQAFMGCSSLAQIIIPATIANIGDYAFSSCSNLNTVYYAGSEAEWNAISSGYGNNNLYSATLYYYSESFPISNGNYWYYDGGRITVWPVSNGLAYSVNDDGVTCTITGIGTCTDRDIYIPQIIDGYRVTAIGSNAFAESDIYNIYIGDGVVTIGDNAFYNCQNLMDVELPDSVQRIEDGAFMSTHLSKINIPDSLTYLGENVFGYNSVPYSVTYYGSAYLEHGIGMTTYSGSSSNPFKILVDVMPYDMAGVVVHKDTKFILERAFVHCDEPFVILYYEGNEAEWQNIINYMQKPAMVYFYSEAYPTTAGNYWHYVDGVPTIWKESEGLAYKVSSGKCTITGIGTCTDTQLVIPSTYDGLPVTGISESAFADCTLIESVVISNGISSIGALAFSGCTSLKSVVIPDSVTNVYGGTFYGCTSLENVRLGSGISNLACVEKSVKEGNVTYYYLYGMFEGCTSLSNIKLPNSIIMIDEKAFCDCIAIKTITIPDSVITIGESAFYGCTSLENIIIPDSVTSVGDAAFARCSSLTEVVLSNNLTEINYRAFDLCTSLKNIVIPDSVTKIGDSFYQCTSLETVVIGKNVTDIEHSAFYGCGISTLVFKNDVIPFDENLGGTYVNHFYSLYNLTTVIIEGNATEIPQNAFKGCESLKTVIISGSVLTIGENAFLNCTSLESIDIPQSVTTVHMSAFKNCSSLTTINFNGTKKQWSLISKEDYWNYNTGEYSIYCTDETIPKIGAKMYDSQGLEYTVNDDGESCSVSSVGTCDKSTIIIPNQVNGYLVTGIGESAFQNYSRLVSITIPESVTRIDAHAFDGCTSLSDINLPKGITRIASSTFYGCTSLSSIEIPNGVQTIGSSAFSSCRNLKTVDIPSSVTLIESYAFYGCSSLQAVNVGQVYNNQWIASYDKNATSGSSMGKFIDSENVASTLTNSTWYSMNFIRC